MTLEEFKKKYFIKHPSLADKKDMFQFISANQELKNGDEVIIRYSGLERWFKYNGDNCIPNAKPFNGSPVNNVKHSETLCFTKEIINELNNLLQDPENFSDVEEYKYVEAMIAEMKSLKFVNIAVKAKKSCLLGGFPIQINPTWSVIDTTNEDKAKSLLKKILPLIEFKTIDVTRLDGKMFHEKVEALKYSIMDAGYKHLTGYMKEAAFTGPEIEFLSNICNFEQYKKVEFLDFPREKSGDYLISYMGIKFTYNVETDIFTEKYDIATILNKIKTVREKLLDIEQIRAECLKYTKSLGITFSMKFGFLKKGTSLSYVDVKLKKEKWTESAKFSLKNKEKLTLKEVRAIIKTIQLSYNNYEQEKKRVEEKLIEDARKNPEYGNLLACEIVEMVEKNSTELITMNRIIAAMRGTSIKGSFDFTKTELSGKFSFLEEGDIIKVAEGLLLKHDVIKETKCRGSYGTFYKYTKGSNNVLYDLLLKKDHVHQIDVDKQGNKIETFTDLDWIYFLDHCDASNISLKTWQKFLVLIERENILCAYPEKVAKFFLKAPENILYYIKSLKEMENGKKKKQLNKVLEFMN